MSESRTDGFYRAAIEHSLRSQRHKIGSKNLIVDYRANDELFTYNGIAQKIISAPAEDALRAGFVLQGIEENQQEKIFSVLEDLDANKIFATALSWDRLQGGAAILMMIDDGGNFSEPLDELKIKSVERLEVYTPEDIFPSKFYENPLEKKFGEPMTYNVTNYYGNFFEVHESRILIFRGGIISNFRRRARNGWGGTVFEQISDDLAHYKESLRLSIAALEKLSQDIMKLDGMTNLMQNDFGEQQVQKRLQLIDMYRHLENVIAIDTADEYDRKNIPLGGVKDIVEQAMYALSAATGIPSTILFGRSPAGMSATGESDLENYYNLVERIQKRTLQPNLSRLIYLISLANNLNFPEEWHIEFNPLWNFSEKEKAEVEKLKSETLSQKANAAKIFVEIGALDGAEVRNSLENDYLIDKSLDKILSAGGQE